MLTTIGLIAAVLTPAAILESPATYEGKQITVSGTVLNLQTSKTLFRKVTGFQLCAAKCVVVIDQTNAPRKDGEQATVTGTFQTTFKAPHRTFKNAVLIK